MIEPERATAGSIPVRRRRPKATRVCRSLDHVVSAEGPLHDELAETSRD
jgi:hypothetical protein